MGTTTSQTIQVIVSPSTPPPTGMPAWLQNPSGRGFPAAVNEWIPIPNSGIQSLLLDYINDPRIGMTYVNDGSGARYGINHYGQTEGPNAVHKTAGQYRYTFGGGAFDSGRYSGRAPSMMFSGEVDFPETSVVRCNPFFDAPFWDIAMWGSHATDIKHRSFGAPLNAADFSFTGTTSAGSRIITGITNIVGTSLPPPIVPVGTFKVGQQIFGAIGTFAPANVASSGVESILSPTSISTLLPMIGNGAFTFTVAGGDGWENNPAVHHPYNKPGVVDDPRPRRNYDGSARGAHTQQRFHFIGQRNWFVPFGGDLFYSDDKGTSGECPVADLTAGHWIYDYPLETIPSFEAFKDTGVVEHPRVKHEITEDVYQVVGDKIIRWNQATNATWVAWWTNPDPNHHGVSNSVAGINWQANYMMVASVLRPGPIASTGSVFYWTVPTTGAGPVSHTEITNFTGNSAAIATIHGSAMANIRNFALTWIPDWGAFILVTITSTTYNLFKLTLTNSTTMDVQPYVPTGTIVGLGTAQNNIHYVSYPLVNPIVKGILFRVFDNALMYFVRTA